MDWECRDCGRVHDEDPGTCVCGSSDIRPRDAGVDRFDRARRLLLDPDSVDDPGLSGGGPAVTFAFRVIIGLMLVVAVAVVASWLL